jgi:hypothetical protein
VKEYGGVRVRPSIHPSVPSRLVSITAERISSKYGSVVNLSIKDVTNHKCLKHVFCLSIPCLKTESNVIFLRSYRANLMSASSGRGVKLTTHLHLAPRSKNAWSYTSNPQYASWHGAQLKKHGDNFTFTLLYRSYLT